MLLGWSGIAKLCGVSIPWLKGLWQGVKHLYRWFYASGKFVYVTWRNWYDVFFREQCICRYSGQSNRARCG